jgi:NAD/NADP transhydrogenase alpha subunit
MVTVVLQEVLHATLANLGDVSQATYMMAQIVTLARQAVMDVLMVVANLQLPAQ